MLKKSFCAKWTGVLLVVAAGISHAQQRRTFVIDGHAGHVPVMEADGTSCVGIEALARLTNGSLHFSGDQITLTLQGSPGQQAGNQGFSRDFLSAAIEAMSEIREWRSALDSAVRYGFPTNTSWVNPFRSAATTSVRQASVAASTESDRNAAQLIGRQLDYMQQLSDKMISMRRNMTYIAPDALDRDPLDKKILNCAHSLAAMEASGQFHDDGSCH